MSGKEDFYIGKRLSYDGALCTVRYNGTLAGTKGTWLGVEWDDTTRGKHDGSHQRQRIFSCLSTSNTAASFVRPTRSSDPQRTFLEALRYKYCGKEDLEEIVQPVEISGKTVETVGFEKIRRQQAELRDLRVAVLDELRLCGIARGRLDSPSLEQAQLDIAETCPNIAELDLGWSLLESWQDVADICRPLKKLRILKVSGVRLHTYVFDSCAATETPFDGVEELHLNETLLRPFQVAQMLNGHLPRLRTLSLSQNDLENLSLLDHSCSLSLTTVETLILDRNAFSDLSPLSPMSQRLPSLKELSLQQNKIDKVGSLVDTSKSPLLSGLRSLNLSRNHISKFDFVDSLSWLFPALSSLRISHNPLYEEQSAKGVNMSSSLPDGSYSFTLARIPSLTVLNYTTITARDREEGEIYYLSAAGKHILSQLEAANAKKEQDVAASVATARREHPRYETLCRKYDRESVLERYTTDVSIAQPSKSSQKYVAGSLAARLVEAQFHNLSESGLVFGRSIARTLDVYRIKALVSRQFDLRPLQFRLIYESEELDPVRDGLDQKSSDWESWGDWDVDGDIDCQTAKAPIKHETWTDGVFVKDGKKWKKREVEIVDGTKAWGDYIGGDETRTVRIRVEPFDKP